jgi:hypothetical protein
MKRARIESLLRAAQALGILYRWLLCQASKPAEKTSRI